MKKILSSQITAFLLGTALLVPLISMANPDPYHVVKASESLGGTPAESGDVEVWVHPTGSDDSANIEWALQNVAPGGTVLLSAGDFYLTSDFVEVYDFEGSFTGVGTANFDSDGNVTNQNSTRVRTGAELPVSREYYPGWDWVEDASMFFFYYEKVDTLRTVSVSDMSLFPTHPTNRLWLHHGIPVNWIRMGIQFLPSPQVPYEDPPDPTYWPRVNVDVKGIETRGSRGAQFQGFGLPHPDGYDGLVYGVGINNPFAGGDVRISGSRFRKQLAGFGTWVTNMDVHVNNNHIEDTTRRGVDIYLNNASLYFSDNLLMNTDDGLFLEPIFSSNINIRKNKFVNSAMGTFFVRNSYWDLGDGESIFDIFDNDVELPSSYQWAGLDMRFLDESSSTKIRNNRFSSLGGAVSDHGYILTLFSKNMRMLNNSFASPTLPSPYGVVLAGSENVELLSNSFGEGMERDVSLGYLGIPEYDSHNCKVVGSKEATTTVLYYTDDNVLINVNGERGNLAPAGDYDSAVLDAGPRSEYTNFRHPNLVN